MYGISKPQQQKTGACIMTVQPHFLCRAIYRPTFGICSECVVGVCVCECIQKNLLLQSQDAMRVCAQN